MDIETVLAALLRELLTQHGFRLPITVASVGVGGSVLFTRFTATSATAPRGSVEQEHIAGELGDEGIAAPVHLMATDATGRARMAVQRPHGPLVVLEQVEPEST